MTQAREPNDYDRQIRHMNRRLERLEDTQVSPQEFERAFDRVYDEIDTLKSEMNQRFDSLEGRFDQLDRKFDIVMQHITGQGNSNT
jgi:ABC-type phosphate transport system auxiliary subunit